jgi:hypothetical protein
VPTEIVLAEGEANCPIEDFEEDDPVAIVNDPELGKVDRAFVIRFNFTCAEPYVKGKEVAIQDGYAPKDGSYVYVWTSLQEVITDEGGIWKGTCDSNPELSRCTFKGEGKYKGLKYYSEYNLKTSDLKFRITTFVSKEQPMAKPTLAPGETVVTEGEANCPVMDFEEEAPLAVVNDPELGDVDRAFVVKYGFACPVPYIKGKTVAIQDGYYLKDGTYVWTSLQEAVTDEGGVWKGTCDNNPKLSRCTLKGEGQYKGLLWYSEYDMETFILIFRITRLVEE